MNLHSLKPSWNLSSGRDRSIRWKPGKAAPHLAKRVRLGHLPEDATLEKYEETIAAVLNQPDVGLYLFVYGSSIYPTAIALVEGRIWLAMLGLDGVLQTDSPLKDKRYGESN